MLSEQEQINLLILGMKADGLGDDLVADGQLGGEAIKAALAFIENEKIFSSSKKPCYFTNESLSFFVSNEELKKIKGYSRAHKCSGSKETIILFFKKHGIELNAD